MNFEAIETAFELLLENVQTIENDLGTHAYDARAVLLRNLQGSSAFRDGGKPSQAESEERP